MGGMQGMFERFEAWFSRKFGPYLGKLLPTYVDTIERNASKAGTLDGIEEGLGRGFEDGYREGLDDGLKRSQQDAFDKGLSQGEEQGYAKGCNAFVIEDRRSPYESTEPSGALYGPGRLSVTEAMRQGMLDDVAALVKAETIEDPTPQQWEMIFSDHPATCVSAGAGSGKSTTLVLRVIFMIRYMKVDSSTITVISFTRASCDELRESFKSVMPHWWGKKIPQQFVDNLVRTFHSVLYHLAKRSFGDITFFETIKNESSLVGAVQDVATEDPELDKIVGRSKLNETQARLIGDAYQSLFHVNEKFRDHVLQLLRMELDRQCLLRSDAGLDTERNGRFYYAAKRDAAVRAIISEHWKKHGWPFDGITAEPVALASRSGQQFLADGYITSTGMPVVLGIPPGLSEEAKNDPVIAEGCKDEALIYALLFRLKVIGRYYEKSYHAITSMQDVARLRTRMEFLCQDATAEGRAPMFDVLVPGEKSGITIHEALFSQGSFIATLGWDAEDLVRHMRPFKVECVEHHFSNALGHFWRHLTEELRNKDILTFDRAFFLLTRQWESVRVDDQKLSALQHLLVDEFQDISPQIARWLTAMQRRLLLRNEATELSFMAIGDDWQSIYGWRGSSPLLFVNFDKYFDVSEQLGGALRLRMETNFRSVESIVSDAAKLIDRIRIRTEKVCTPGRTTSPGDHGVEVREYGQGKPHPKDHEVLPSLIEFIENKYGEAKGMTHPYKEHVIVMTRRGELRKALSSHFRKKKLKGLSFHTYHQAKGLQADTAIMIEPCLIPASYPLRNAIYAASGLFPADYTYDLAMADEALRLAYVGVTRGRRRVYWQVYDLTSSESARLFVDRFA